MGNWTTESMLTKTKWDARPPPSLQVRHHTHTRKQGLLYYKDGWRFLKRASLPLVQTTLSSWATTSETEPEGLCSSTPPSNSKTPPPPNILVHTKIKSRHHGPDRHQVNKLSGTAGVVMLALIRLLRPLQPLKLQESGSHVLDWSKPDCVPCWFQSYLGDGCVSVCLKCPVLLHCVS